MSPAGVARTSVECQPPAMFQGPAPPDEGVLVYGLYLAGASWDPLSHSLQELQPNIQHCPLPELHVLPCRVNG